MIADNHIFAPSGVDFIAFSPIYPPEFDVYIVNFCLILSFVLICCFVAFCYICPFALLQFVWRDLIDIVVEPIVEKQIGGGFPFHINDFKFFVNKIVGRCFYRQSF